VFSLVGTAHPTKKQTNNILAKYFIKITAFSNYREAWILSPFKRNGKLE